MAHGTPETTQPEQLSRLPGQTAPDVERQDGMTGRQELMEQDGAVDSTTEQDADRTASRRHAFEIALIFGERNTSWLEKSMQEPAG